MINRFLKLLVIFLVLVIQIGWLGNFDFMRTKLNILIVTLTFFIFLFDFKELIGWTLLAGYIMDLYSSLPFGLISISLIISLIFSYFLFRNYFTNRSLISLSILVASTTAAFHLVIIFLGWLAGQIGFSFYEFSNSWVTSSIWQIVFNAILAAISFSVYTYLTNRLKRNFLVKGNL